VTFQDFIRKVGKRAGIADYFEADKTSVVVPQTLCSRLTGKEASDLLSQLPAMFRELFIVSPSPLPLSAEGLVERVADELRMPPDEARARAVFATLREAVTPSEFQVVLEQVDPDCADLLA
jgi:uncharacterized protein (DUF2267 family)